MATGAAQRWHRAGRNTTRAAAPCSASALAAPALARMIIAGKRIPPGMCAGKRIACLRNLREGAGARKFCHVDGRTGVAAGR